MSRPRRTPSSPSRRTSGRPALRRVLSRLRPGRRRATAGADDGPDDTFRGTLAYAPRADGAADPGEVVWAWVPYEEGDGRGKDRPVLLVGRRPAGPTGGERWLGLMLTSKDHDRDAAQEAHWGRHWMDVGTGGWDRQRRPSEVRLDRLLLLDPAGIRREGAALDRATFDRVVAAARELHVLS